MDSALSVYMVDGLAVVKANVGAVEMKSNVLRNIFKLHNSPAKLMMC